MFSGRSPSARPAVPRGTSAAVRLACLGTHPVMLYVTDDVTVTPVCATTGTVLNAMKTGPGPDHLVATPDGKTLYVSNGGIGETIGHTVTVISRAVQP
jgi:DNA-binding beta-propeller fold protein YncE